MSEGSREVPLSGDRRLAAIVFTDVAGYSARMQQDETGTMALVRADFSVMRDLCTKHGGEILKSTGDGLLMCFSSVVQAVASALQIQAGFAGRQAGGLQHRIGIHLGDVFREDGDVAGDGVNIAARLQTRARPGTLCVSQSVYDAVKGKLPMQAESLGPQPFKNIAEPVTVFLLAPAGAVVPPATRSVKPGRKRLLGVAAVLLAGAMAVVFWPRPTQPKEPQPAAPGPAAPVSDKSIAVLPFTNMSDDKDSGYFADGIHEDLLTNLGVVRELHVTSRTSVMQYRGTTKPIRQIGAELGVAYVLEGSVRRAGNKVRVTGQLINARTDEHVWAKYYDRDLTDIFAIQAELSQEITTALSAAISPQEKSLLENRPTTNLAAYDLLLKARAGGLVEEQEEWLLEAVKLDPAFAQAWAQLSKVHVLEVLNEIDHSPERLAKAKAAIDTAVRLAPGDPVVIQLLGTYYYYGFRDYARAAEQYQRLLLLRPNSSEAVGWLGLLYRRQGRWAEALASMGKAAQLDPRSVDWPWNIAVVLQAARHYDEAVKEFRWVEERDTGELFYPAFRPQISPQVAFYARGSTREMEAWFAEQKSVGADETGLLYIRLKWLRLRGDWAQAVQLDRQHPYIDFEGEPHWWQDANAVLDLVGHGELDAARLRAKGITPLLVALGEKQSNNADLWRLLASLQMISGDRVSALRSARKMLELRSESTDAYEGPRYSLAFAQVLAWTGDKDSSIAELARLLRTPFGENVYAARADPGWLPLHGDPRFEALLNDPANNAPLF